MKKYKLIKDYPYAPCHVGESIIEAHECSLYPEFWQEVKEPLFVTEDGVEIHDENQLFFWSDDRFIPHSCHYSSGTYDETTKYYSSIEAITKWIEQNKPVFSRKQVLDALSRSYKAIHNRTSTNTDTGNYALSETLFKKELGL